MTHTKHYSEFFIDYFRVTQCKDGGWTALEKDHQNEIAKVVYTCQVLLSLKECFRLTPRLEQLVHAGIASLEDICVSNPLFQQLLKLKSLYAWKDFVSIDSLVAHTLYRLDRKIGDFGGRLNSYSFELVFSLEVLLDCDLLSKLSRKARRRYEVMLNSLLKQGPQYLPDISHYSWMLDIKLRMGDESVSSWIDVFAEELSKHPIDHGLWLLKADWDKPSNTPALRCNEFLSAHIVLSSSRVLARCFHEKLYALILDSVKQFVYSFNMGDLWVTHSQLTGNQRADPYMSGLILRSINQFSTISDESHREGLLEFKKSFEGYLQNNKHMSWLSRNARRLANEQASKPELVASEVSTKSGADRRESLATAKTVYIVWENLVNVKEEKPDKVEEEKDLDRYIKHAAEYDVWIREPEEYCHFGKKVSPPQPRLIKLMKVMLRSVHMGKVYLEDMYEAVGNPLTDFDDMIDETNALKRLRNDLSACHKPFGRCINPKEHSGRWRKDKPRPFFLFIHEFKYCFIEEILSINR